MEAKIIDLKEWKQFGEGGEGKSYVNIADDRLFMKLNNTAVDRERAEREYHFSKIFCTMGLPTPKVYDFVTDGQRYGYTGEFMKGKKSYSSIMAANPERIDEMARRFAERAKELHAIKADTSILPDAKEKKRKYLGDMDFVPQDVARTVSGYFDCIKQKDNCLIVDLNPGNLILCNGKDYWIDTGTVGYGDPISDFASMYMSLNFLPRNMVKKLFHLTHRQFKLFYTKVLQYYFGQTSVDSAIMEKIRKIALISCCCAIKYKPSSASLFIPLLRGQTFKFELIRFVASFLMR